jgi:AraC family transcriptional regulator of adaptative response/methylated-DNA-[protein]-cysteine methyltransferase
MSKLPPHDELFAAHRRRDPAYNGIFFLAVKTTGIFCRPTCPARPPLPRNIEYYATAREALFAGYRPCKRCKPLATSEQPGWAAKLIADVEAHPDVRITEHQLKQRGVDPATVRRYFQKEYAMTFQAYARARRLTHALSHIRNGSKVDDAVFSSGYESHSGFRDAFSKHFDTTPADAEQKDCILLQWIASPLGPLVAGANSDGIVLLEFTDRRMMETQIKTLRRLFGVPLLPGSNKHLVQLERELKDYFTGTLKRFTVKLSYPGTPFQQNVWKHLLKIPYGQTQSYQQLATAVGIPGAVRAVGTTNGKNRIAIVIPCHRVVNKNGKLGGYGGGLRRKEFLLQLEGASLDSLYEAK